MSSPEPPFPSIAIVGLGLIGGSIALGVRERWPSSRVIGVDTESVAAHALGSGAIEKAVGSVTDLPPVSLIVLAAPVRQNIELLQQLARKSCLAPVAVPTSASGGRLRPETSIAPLVVTDVGGTKREILRAAEALPPEIAFVGGHPLGGGERGGFAFARPDLFTSRPWIFTPASNGSTDAVERLSRFVKGLGARPSTLSAEQHDHLMAFVSHLPQLTASALMETVGAAAHAEGLRMAGRGLADTTRLASSPADVWRDICLTNADSIDEAIGCLIERLTQLRRDLRRGDAIEAIFTAASRWRAELMKERE